MKKNPDPGIIKTNSLNEIHYDFPKHETFRKFTEFMMVASNM